MSRASSSPANSTPATAKQNSYTFGHSPAFISSHTSRTAANSAAYLLPHLSPTSTILDVGCGPGTITRDFAAVATSGKVVGLDSSAAVISKAQESAAAAASSHGSLAANLTFQTGDAHNLPFDDDSFDVVHAHALLVHLPDARRTLAEMRRVCKPGGVVAVRECDMDTLLMHPETEHLRKWMGVYKIVAAAEGADMNAGRRLCEWACGVGYARADVQVSAGTLTYAQEVERKWWGELQALRMEEEGGTLRSRMLSGGRYTELEIEQMAKALRDWGAEEYGIFSLLVVQILCWK